MRKRGRFAIVCYFPDGSRLGIETRRDRSLTPEEIVQELRRAIDLIERGNRALAKKEPSA